MGERAFILEDDVRQIRIVRLALRPDFEFVEARDMRTARRLLRRAVDEYSLPVIDIHIAEDDEDGLVLFDELQPRAREASFILMSGDTSARMVNYVHGKPRSTFLAKPFSVSALRAIAASARVVTCEDDAITETATKLTASWQLSPTERRVLAAHLDGKTKRETCATLRFNERTHESHVTHILSKASRARRSFERFSDLVHEVLRTRRR